jgi:glycosyltransferase involved in cell wall biosynthesis
MNNVTSNISESVHQLLGNKPTHRVAFLASFPPRQCGIATFTSDVIQALVQQSPQIKPIVIALENTKMVQGLNYPSMVKFVLPQYNRAEYKKAAEFINNSNAEVLCVQHEFGLYGGDAGEWLLDVLSRIEIPIVSVLHTVLPNPTPAYVRVMREIERFSEQIVVLTQTSAQLLHDVYGLKKQQVRVIHHGVPDVPFLPTDKAKEKLNLAGRTVLTTFGLINKGKGIEYAIESLLPVVARYPQVKYLVLGGTHPVVRQREGESYRESLEARVQELGLTDHVQFENRFLDFDDLCSYLAATDIYLTPYLGKDQIVSGTLAYALGFGNAVISTPYLYAKEVLANQRGLLVDWKDSASISTALLSLLDSPTLLAQTRQAAYQYGHQMAWPNVGRQYAGLFENLIMVRRATQLITPASRFVQNYPLVRQ